MSKNRISLWIIALVVMGLAFTTVSVQASAVPVVTVQYAGAIVKLHGVNLVLEPGDTTAAAQILSSPNPFTVIVFADSAARDLGTDIGRGQSTCAMGAMGQECTLSVMGTTTAMLIDVVFAPVAGMVNTFSYGGNDLAAFYGMNVVFPAGTTTGSPETLTVSVPFAYRSYLNKAALVSGAVLSTVANTACPLVCNGYTATVSGTNSNVWLEVVLGATAPVVVNATAAPNAIVFATPSAPAVGGGANPPVVATLPAAITSGAQNGWNIQYFTGATAAMQTYQFPALNPRVWNVFPNVDNRAARFLAANGLEYGEDESQTCGAANDACSIVVAARSYVIITGDRSLNGLGSCVAANGQGCVTMIVNVGDVSAEFTGILNNVFVIQGRYWNGEPNFLPTAIVAGLSHANYNMLNLSNNSANAGANCSVPGGCITTNTEAFITSGNQPLVKIATTGTR